MSATQQFSNFKLIDGHVDINLICEELQANKVLWLANTMRQKNNRVQRETQSIFLRGPDMAAYPPNTHVNDVHISKETNFACRFLQSMDYLYKMAASLDSELERAIIVRLKGNGDVYPHSDEGSYYEPRNRYHLVLKSPAGSQLTSGEETVVMNEGELWWFDNKKRHAAKNRSTDWRVHIIFDLFPKIYRQP